MQKFNVNNPPSRHNPFRVPDGYFEQMADSVMRRVRHLPAAAPVRPLPIVRWIPLLGAACVAALAIVFARVGDGNQHDMGSVQASAVSSTQQSTDEAIFDYLMLADADILNIDGEY